jgi:hypothetical protein
VQLPDLLKSKRTAIVERWKELALQSYPQDSVPFLRQERDRFCNPIGHLTGESLEAVFEGLVAGRPAEQTRAALDGIVRVRAVQDLSASQAVGFVFLLERAIREELGEAGASRVSGAEWSALRAGIDELALQAFDLFMECREKIYELRADEVKRRTSRLLERLQRQVVQDEAGPDPLESGPHAKGGCGA